MQAGRVIGTGISHAARAAHIPRSCDPHACEGDAGLLRYPVDDRLEDLVNRAFAGDTHREFLQSFKVHDVISKPYHMPCVAILKLHAPWNVVVSVR
jgi:hypothetical protein